VSAQYDDSDVFENYLTNRAEVFQGFEKVFKIRAQEMFGKNLHDLSTSEYLDMIERIAKVVFIAEK
jgi:hypothetical protein